MISICTVNNKKIPVEDVTTDSLRVEERRGSMPRLPSSLESEGFVISPGSSRTVLGDLNCMYCLEKRSFYLTR